MIRYKTNKYNAKKTVINGIRFDSQAEAEMYKILKLQENTAHIDCHVPITLPCGVKLNVDFIVYTKDGFVKAYECKGKPTQDFKTKRKLFDNSHPLAPLEVWSKKGGGWEKL